MNHTEQTLCKVACWAGVPFGSATEFQQKKERHEPFTCCCFCKRISVKLRLRKRQFLGWALKFAIDHSIIFYLGWAISNLSQINLLLHLLANSWWLARYGRIVCTCRKNSRKRRVVWSCFMNQQHWCSPVGMMFRGLFAPT
jgi:hypothetical protein